MKKSILIVLGTISLAMGLGTGIANLSAAKPIEAAADDPVTVYLDWSNAQAWKDVSVSKIYFRTSDSNFYECTKVADYVYKYTYSYLPYGGFAFRTSNSGHDDEWETKWYNVSDGKNVFVVTGEQDSSDHNRFICSTGFIDSFASANVGTVSPIGPSYNTKRLWTSAVDLSWWGVSTARVGNHATGKADYYEMTPYVVNSGHTLYYVDVPLDADYVNIVRKTGLINGWYNIAPDVKNNTSEVSYIKQGKDLYVDVGSLPGGKADLAGKVLEGYLTCSSSAVNGYGAVKDLNDNFISQLASGEKAKMSNVNITDYAYHNTKETYSGSDVKNLTVTAAEKWAAMCTLYNASNGTNYSALAMPKERSGSAPTAIVAALTSLGVIAAGAMVFLAKRRKDI